MKLRSTLVSFALLFVAASAFAWPTCKGNWVQVPKGTGSTNGVIYITGDNLTFQCQVPPPVTPPVKPTPVSTSSSSSSSANSAANSSANSASNSSSNQNQKQSQQQGQTANGGSATSTSSATENGNNSNNTSSVTNIAAPKIPVATAYAPSSYPTVTCFKGFGAGVQTASIGASFGGGKIDENCAILEAAKNAQSKLAFCKVYISNKYVKKAGVTLSDCIGEVQEPAVVTVFAPPVAPPPPPVVETPILTIIPATDFGTCAFPTGSRLTNECKAVLDTAVIYSKKASGGYVVIEADALTGVLKAQATQKYLEHAGVDGNNILIKMTKKPTPLVAVSYSEQ